MRIGTKSLLFGCHQFIIHPLFVYVAWIKLYKSLPNWKETVCIIIHDWGYWGLENMDDEKGEDHPIWAAEFARKLETDRSHGRYFNLCYRHSRFKSKQAMMEPSKLCWADKLGTALMPAWLWVLSGTITGEIKEYMSHKKFEINSNKWDCPYKFFARYRLLVKDLLTENNLKERSY